jgi:hypothetical protein
MYKLKCLYRRKFEAEKSLLRPPSAIFGGGVKVLFGRKSHFYGRGAAEEFYGNFYGPCFRVFRRINI